MHVVKIMCHTLREQALLAIQPRSAVASRVDESAAEVKVLVPAVTLPHIISRAHARARTHTLVGWKKLWDHTLDHGEPCIMSLKNLVTIVTYPKYASNICPLCEVAELNESLPDHIIGQHTISNEPWHTLFNSLLNLDPSLYSLIICLRNLF